MDYELHSFRVERLRRAPTNAEMPTAGDLKSRVFSLDHRTTGPPTELANTIPFPENFFFSFGPPAQPPPYRAILQEKGGSICQGLRLAEHSSNQALAYIRVTKKKLSYFCLQRTTCIT